MKWPKVNKPLKFRFLRTCYGVLKTTQVIVHTGLLIFCFSAFDLNEDSLLRFSSLISLYMLILNMWSIFMGIVFQVKRKLLCAYETILTVSMLVVYGLLIATLLVNDQIKNSEYEVQITNDTKDTEKFNEELEDNAKTMQPPKDQYFINNMWKEFSVHDLQKSLAIPVVVLLFQLLIIVINSHEAFPNVTLESESHEGHRGQPIQLTVMESMGRRFYSRNEERERRFVTKEGEVLTPDTVDTVSETRPKSLTLHPKTTAHENPIPVEEESLVSSPRASASEHSSDSEESSLTYRRARGSKSITPEPPFREEKEKITRF